MVPWVLIIRRSRGGVRAGQPDRPRVCCHGRIWRQGLMPSRRIPSACPGWRRHTRPAGNSWRRQAGSWLCRPQRRWAPPFLPTLARLRIPRRFRRGRYIRLWQSSSRRWEPGISLFETLSSDAGLLDVVGAIKAEVPDAFVLVSFAVLPDGLDPGGMYCKDLARRMQESGIVDAVGLNCVSAPGRHAHTGKQLGARCPCRSCPTRVIPLSPGRR